LKVTLEQARARKAPAANPAEVQRLTQQLAEVNRRLAEQAARADALASDKAALQKELKARGRTAKASAEPEQTRKALDEVNRKLAEQTALARQLTREQETLQTQLRRLRTEADAATALRAENALLKKQLASLQTGAKSSAAAESSRALKAARARIAALQSDLELLRAENRALQDRVQTLSAAASAAAATATESASASDRLRQLERGARPPTTAPGRRHAGTGQPQEPPHFDARAGVGAAGGGAARALAGPGSPGGAVHP